MYTYSYYAPRAPPLLTIPCQPILPLLLPSYTILDPPSSSSSHTPFSDLYDLGEKVRCDYHTTLRRCTHISTHTQFTCKSIHKSSICTLAHIDSVRREVSIMQSLSASASRTELLSIVKLHEVIEEERNIHLIMELCLGESLYNRLELQKKTKNNATSISKKNVRSRSQLQLPVFAEEEVAVIMKGLLEALLVCHSRGIIHRNVRLENVLVDEDSKVKVKLVDFERAITTSEEGDMSFAGADPLYVAPEVVEGGAYGEATDMWSAGVVAYALLAGRQPFAGADVESVKCAVVAAEPSFASSPWIFVSFSAKCFVRGLLCRDPQQRLSVSEALAHPWILGHCVRRG